MGILDLPAPALTALDTALAPVLPPAARLLVWAALGAFLSLELYRLLSPQARIAALKDSFEEARREVDAFDGAFAEAWPKLRRMMGLALRRVGLVFPATVAASLPLLVVIVWIDGHYGTVYPPRDRLVSVSVPGGFEGRWMPAADGVPHARVTDGDGGPVADIAVSEPVPVIHKRVWWNALIGNPAGYLDDSLPFDWIDLDLPRRQVLPFGPNWLRGWEAVFFAAMLVFAMTFKNLRRIA